MRINREDLVTGKTTEVVRYTGISAWTGDNFTRQVAQGEAQEIGGRLSFDVGMMGTGNAVATVFVDDAPVARFSQTWPEEDDDVCGLT